MYTFALPLDRALATAAGSCAVVCQDRRGTYAELGSRCRRLAGGLRALGLAPGDRVGVISLNSDRYLELYLGVPAAGLVLVPVNSRLAPAEMQAILADAAERHEGSWWEHWAGWLAERSGEQSAAPHALGSTRFPPIEAAPGSYVRL